MNVINMHRESKEMYMQIRKVSSCKLSPKQICINNIDGEPLVEPAEILNRWKDYGTALFGDSKK